MISSLQTGERASAFHDGSTAQQFLFARQLAAYHLASEFLGGAETVYDLASGTGYGTFHLAQCDRTVIGVDCSAQAIAESRRQWQRANLSFVQQDVTELQVPACSNAAVCSFQTIEHVQDDSAFVSVLARLAGAAGVCLVSTPNRRLRLRDGQKPWNRFHVREYDAETLEELLRQSFHEVRIMGIQALPQWEEYERRRIQQARMVADLDPLRLRHRIPVGVSAGVRSLLQIVLRTCHQPKVPASENEISPDDFFLTDDCRRCMDLFAVCRSARFAAGDV